MRIVAGKIDMAPGTRQDFLEAVVPMVTVTRAEAGCREYVFSPDPDNDDRIRLYELWDDQEALDQHLDSDHMASWQKIRSGLPITESSILKYSVSDVGPVR